MNPLTVEHVRIGSRGVVHLRVVAYAPALVEDWQLLPHYFEHLPKPGELLCGNRGDAHPSDSPGRLCRRCEIRSEEMDHDLDVARRQVGIAFAEPVARDW